MKILTQQCKILNLDSPFFEDIFISSDTRNNQTLWDVEAHIMSPTGSMHSHLIKHSFPDPESARGFVKTLWDFMKQHAPGAGFFDVNEH